MIRRENYRNDEAVSEVIGFILILGVVVIGMGIIYVVGYPLLQSNMDSSIFEGAEQSFIVVQSDMKMVSFDQTPVKNMNMKLHSASLSIDEDSSLEIQYDGPIYHNYSVGSIEYMQGDEAITYENGAVIVRYETGSPLMISDPRIYSTTVDNTNITTFGIVNVNGNESIAGANSVVTLKMEHNRSEIIKTPNPVNVTVTMNTKYTKVWSEYFLDMGFIPGPSDPGKNFTVYRNDTYLIIGNHTVDTTLS